MHIIEIPNTVSLQLKGGPFSLRTLFLFAICHVCTLLSFVNCFAIFLQFVEASTYLGA